MGMYRPIVGDALMTEWQRKGIKHCFCVSPTVKSRASRISVNPRAQLPGLRPRLSCRARGTKGLCYSRYGMRASRRPSQEGGCVYPCPIAVESNPQLPEFLLRDYGIRPLTEVIFNYRNAAPTIYERGD